MGRSRRHTIARVLLLGGMLVPLFPVPASAALLWTLTASPLSATTGVPTTYLLTATNGDLLSEIGCVIVDVPANFSVTAVAISASNAGDSWVASLFGNRVTVRTTSGGDRLELLQWVRFTVRATALSAGSLAWNANAYARQDCTRSGSLLGVPPIVVVTGPAATPTPTPMPTPTPTPILSLPTPSGSLPLPSLPQPSSTSSATASPALSPGATTSPEPSTTAAAGQSGGAAPTPSASAEAIPAASSGPSGGTASPSSSAGSGDPESRLPSIGFDERRLDLGGASIGLFAGVEIWAVPAATIALPGLLVLIWVALQAVGAIAWIPATRRLRGEDGARQRARSRTPGR